MGALFGRAVKLRVVGAHGSAASWREGELYGHGRYYEGEKDGEWFEESIEECERRVSYRLGERDGTSRESCADGSFEEVQWRADKRHGLTVEIRAGGKKRVEIEYVDGLRQGLERRWIDDELVEEGRWEADKREGVWRSKYYGAWQENLYRNDKEVSPEAAATIIDFEDSSNVWVHSHGNFLFPLNDEGAILYLFGLIVRYPFAKLGLLEVGALLGPLLPEEDDPDYTFGLAYRAWLQGGLGFRFLGVGLRFFSGLSIMRASDWFGASLHLPIRSEVHVPFSDWLGLILNLRYAYPLLPDEWDPNDRSLDGLENGTLNAELLFEFISSGSLLFRTGLSSQYLSGSWMLGFCLQIGPT